MSSWKNPKPSRRADYGKYYKPLSFAHARDSRDGVAFRKVRALFKAYYRDEELAHTMNRQMTDKKEATNGT